MTSMDGNLDFVIEEVNHFGEELKVQMPQIYKKLCGNDVKIKKVINRFQLWPILQDSI